MVFGLVVMCLLFGVGIGCCAVGVCLVYLPHLVFVVLLVVMVVVKCFGC